MYILTYSGNWNNEINVDGFNLISNKNRTKIINCLTDYNDIIYISNGGDDEIEYENGKELLEEINFQKITNECEINTIKKYFGDSNDFGNNLLIDLSKLLQSYEISCY